MYLMTVAADDGVMPQTREHAAVLHALGIGSGVVAVTKSDLADPELAMVEASELLPGLSWSSLGAHRRGARPSSGPRRPGGRASCEAEQGRQGTAAAAHRPRVHDPRRRDGGHRDTVVWVDRSLETRSRSCPTGWGAGPRGADPRCGCASEPRAGQRVAVDLTGVAVGEIDTWRGAGTPATRICGRRTLIDAELVVRGREPEHGARVQVHHGARESPARLAWLGGPFWQVRLEQPLVPVPGDRLVIRQIAPPDTIGGGTVLDAKPA